MSLSHRFRFVALVCPLIAIAAPIAAQQFDSAMLKEMRWRNVGPFRGSRRVARAEASPCSDSVGAAADTTPSFGSVGGQMSGLLGLLQDADMPPTLTMVNAKRPAHRMVSRPSGVMARRPQRAWP